jgi:hypothetical protein
MLRRRGVPVQKGEVWICLVTAAANEDAHFVKGNFYVRRKLVADL